MQKEEWIKEIELFLFDIDGVFIIGKSDPIFLGGRKLLERLIAQGKKFAFITNNTTHPREKVAQLLKRYSLPVKAEQIWTAVDVTFHYIKNKFGNSVEVFILGEPPIIELAKKQGFIVKEDGSDVDLVIVCLDRGVTYKKLTVALNAILKGAKLIACHKNQRWLSENGIEPSVGPFVAFLEYAAGINNSEVVGKPSPLIYKEVCKYYNIAPEKALMIGDDLIADIKGAKEAGLHTVLVLSGLTKKDEIQYFPLTPDIILRNVDELITFI